MRAPYGFGVSQEDERTEARALGLPGGRVLSIASAGDMPLSLLAMGADAVTAVDIDEGQLCLAQLKLATALRLDPPEAARFLGFLPAPEERRRAWYAAVRPALSAPARAWWDARSKGLERGAIWLGSYERFVGRIRSLIGPWLRPRVAALLEAPDLAAQERAFERRLDRPALRAVFRLAFHPRLYAGRGVDPRAVQHRSRDVPLGDLYFERFRRLCTESPARANPLLQLHLLGRVVADDVVPTWLTPQGLEALRARAGRIGFETGDIRRFLSTRPPGAFDRFHLSNVPDWLPRPEFEALLSQIAARSGRPGRAVWRSLHAPVPAPESLAGRLRVDAELGRELTLRDRFPLYDVSPAEMAP